MCLTFFAVSASRRKSRRRLGLGSSLHHHNSKKKRDIYLQELEIIHSSHELTADGRDEMLITAGIVFSCVFGDFVPAFDPCFVCTDKPLKPVTAALPSRPWIIENVSAQLALLKRKKEPNGMNPDGLFLSSWPCGCVSWTSSHRKQQDSLERLD
jgi:hypothetical protein